MKYNGNFRLSNSSKPIKRNPAPSIPLKPAYSERGMREASATAEDAIASVNGARYCCKSGKINIGYYSSKGDAIFDANRNGAIAYEIIRDSVGKISLIEIDGDISESPTVSELIADKVREQITTSDAPLSPLVKQRVVIILRSSCRDKDISFDAFKILFPVSSQEQFNRLWENAAHSNDNGEVINQFDNFAASRGMNLLVNAVISGDIKSCEKSIERNFTIRDFEDIVSFARNNNTELNKDAVEYVRRRLAQNTVENRIQDGDIVRMINNNKILRSMALSGNTDGIIEYLCSNGYSNREAEELADEIVSVSNLIAKL